MTSGGRFAGRRGRLWLAGLGIAAAALGAWAAPVPAGVPPTDARATSTFAAFASASIVTFAILPFALWRGAWRRVIWISIAVSALLLGIGGFLASGHWQRVCTATYAGTRVIGGTELTPLAARYLAANPDTTRDELLFDARGEVQRVWTPASINRCRTSIAGTYYLWIPFLVMCLLAAVQAMPSGPLSVPVTDTRPPPASPSVPVRYDAFISYRHGGADAEMARALLETLESDGYKVAIDERDFAANETFLQEMERCIRESRFTIAIISRRYLDSGNCQEEAIVCKVLDMDERRRRLIPFVIERVAMPAWLYGIVGISRTTEAPLVDPLEKLKATLGMPLAR